MTDNTYANPKNLNDAHILFLYEALLENHALWRMVASGDASVSDAIESLDDEEEVLRSIERDMFVVSLRGGDE